MEFSGLGAGAILAGIILGQGGIVMVSVKAGLNGARQQIKETRSDVKEIKETTANIYERQIDHESRISRIEGANNAIGQ
jgi:hypothetical protein